eukprot:83045-Hanusia_phi.AAC.1
MSGRWDVLFKVTPPEDLLKRSADPVSAHPHRGYRDRKGCCCSSQSNRFSDCLPVLPAALAGGREHAVDPACRREECEASDLGYSWAGALQSGDAELLPVRGATG